MWSLLSGALQLDIENGLVCLEDHPVVHLEVFVEVQPGSIGAWLVVEAVGEDPGLLLSVKCDTCLTLRQ